MKRIHPEDPRVTAHALGELPAHEAAEVERAAGANPAIQEALEETHALASLIHAGFKAESHELGEARREAIRRAGRRPAPENLVSMKRGRWVRPTLVTAAAAVLVACAVWMMQRIPAGDPGVAGAEREAELRDEVRTQMLLSPAPRPEPLEQGAVPASPATPAPDHYQLDEGLSPEAVEEEFELLRGLLEDDPTSYREQVEERARQADRAVLSKLPNLTDNSFLPAREHPLSTVPIVSGSASFSLVDRFIRTEGALPPRNGVRIEELINHLVFEDRGDADLDGIRLGAELMRCPWDPGAILMGVLLHNGSGKVIPGNALLGIEVRPEFIRSYRLIGYAGVPGPDANGGAVLRGLAPGRSNFVLYQLQPLQKEVFRQHRVVAQVVLRLGDVHAQGLMVPVSSPPRDWENASNNFQTAVTLGAWGMLLRDSPYRGELDPAMLETLAVKSQAGVEEGDLARREALQLVRDSLPLLQSAP